MESKNKKDAVRIVDGNSGEVPAALGQEGLLSKEKIKKPLILALMTLAFAGCIYLIFKPGPNKKMQDPGLNEAVPQATDAALQADKQKAYELAMLENKIAQKQHALSSLADYWQKEESTGPGEKTDTEAAQAAPTNPALNSYRDAQRTLGDFYREDNGAARQLQKEVEALKQQLADQESARQPDPVQTQLTLMEKSYQMAAKYLPGNSTHEMPEKMAPPKEDSGKLTRTTTPLFPEGQRGISALYRVPTDSAFRAAYGKERHTGFYTVAGNSKTELAKNSIRAVIHQTRELGTEGTVPVRLLEPARLQQVTIPQGTVLTAQTKLYQGRLQMAITSIEVSGHIFPVDLSVYDLNGQQGLAVPYSAAMNALTEIAANMAQTSGTSITMNRSAGQQIAGDLSRGLIQGVSGYVSKKLKTPKVKIKAGFQLLLLSKNK